MKPVQLYEGRAVRVAIRSVGAHRLLLPPYSPDLNPIEQAFSKRIDDVIAFRSRQGAGHPAFHWVNTVLANIKTAIVATYKAVRKTPRAHPRRVRMALQS